MMQNKRNNKGFTMTELLMVVAILAILAALAFIALPRYLRGLRQLEMDSYAKEVFIAAQNHLTMADNEGYLGRDGFGATEQKIDGTSDTGDGVYYFVVRSAADFSSGSVLDLMLPPSALDETVRLGGSYIIRYHKDSAQVLDVFYAAQSGRFAHTFSGTEYAGLLRGYRDSETVSHKSDRKNYNDGSAVIGWYGGVEASNLTLGAALQEPAITVQNAEKLTVTITNPNTANDDAALKLVIRGQASGKEIVIDLLSPGDYARFVSGAGAGTITVTLDDVTSIEKLHFSDLNGVQASGLIPGEDLSIHAVASYGGSQLGNVASSAVRTANSLFADGTDDTTAKIANIRHLENLDPAVSALSYGGDAVKITKAEQTVNLSWTDFKNAIHNDSCSVYLLNNAGNSALGTFLPVNASYGLAYDGNGCSISDLSVDTSGAAGLFGTLTGGSVTDLRLVDCTVKSTGGSAGTLAGALTNVSVTGVLAHHTGSGAANVSGVSAGGLVGMLSDSTVDQSAAAVTVSGSGSTGGLVGSAADSTVKNSYSGGHTVDGAYSASSFNVTSSGGSAGGLVGAAGNTDVLGCYSTCSARGAENAGGLVGLVSGGKVSGCYAAGLVQGGTARALVGSGGDSLVSAANNHYFSIINEGMAAGVSASAIDADLASYRSFVTLTASAAPYDSTLTAEYGGQYTLRTIAQFTGATGFDFLSTHYGDWPAPELKVENTKG